MASKYYTPDVLERIRQALSYQDLLAIAIDVLKTIYNDRPLKPIAMVCGPISTGGKGSREENLKIFDRAINLLLAGGSVIFNQMPFENDMKRIYQSNSDLQGTRLLEEFYLPIFEMGFIKLLLFLPGWEGSVGSRWEHEQAKRLGIPVLYLAESYTTDPGGV